MRRLRGGLGATLLILIVGAIGATYYLQEHNSSALSVVSPLESPQTAPSMAAGSDGSRATGGDSISPEPSYASTTGSGAIPTCVLEQPQADGTAEHVPASYRFSMPQVVLTRTSAIAIADWKPDSTELAVALAVPSSPYEELAAFDVSTGGLQIYAERRRVGTKPTWSAGALVYGDRLDDGTSVIKTARSDGHISVVSKPSADTSVVSRLGGDEVGFMMASATPTLGLLSSLEPGDAQGVRAHQIPGSDMLSSAFPGRLLAWQPESSRLILSGEGEVLSVDAVSGAICRLPLTEDTSGGAGASITVLGARYSPDGRYLALLVIKGEAPAAGSSVLLIDGADGSREELGPPAIIADGLAFVMDLAWAPDAVTLLLRSTVAQDDGVLMDGLFLVDARSGAVERVLPELDFAGGDAGWNLSWSANGKWLALACPTKEEGRICLVSVTSE